MEENAHSSPPFPPRADSVLGEWANAHAQLLLEESNLVNLCRRLASREVTDDHVSSQRARVARLREFAEGLYSEAMKYLAAGS